MGKNKFILSVTSQDNNSTLYLKRKKGKKVPKYSLTDNIDQCTSFISVYDAFDNFKLHYHSIGYMRNIKTIDIKDVTGHTDPVTIDMTKMSSISTEIHTRMVEVAELKRSLMHEFAIELGNIEGKSNEYTITMSMRKHAEKLIEAVEVLKCDISKILPKDTILELTNILNIPKEEITNE